MQQRDDLVRRALVRFQNGGGGAATLNRLKSGGYDVPKRTAPGKAASVTGPDHNTIAGTPNPIGLGIKRNLLMGQAITRAETAKAAGKQVGAGTQRRLSGTVPTGKGVGVRGNAALQNPQIREHLMAYLRKSAPFGKSAGGRYSGGF